MGIAAGPVQLCIDNPDFLQERNPVVISAMHIAKGDHAARCTDIEVIGGLHRRCDQQGQQNSVDYSERKHERGSPDH